MKKLLTFVLAVTSIVFCGLYVRERNKPPKEVERIVERKVEVPVEVVKEVRVPVEIVKEVKIPVEVVKEVPAQIPIEYQKAYQEKILVNEAQKEAFQRAVALESHTQSAPDRIAAYMQVVAMEPTSQFGKAASDRVAQLNALLETLVRGMSH